MGDGLIILGVIGNGGCSVYDVEQSEQEVILATKGPEVTYEISVHFDCKLSHPAFARLYRRASVSYLLQISHFRHTTRDRSESLLFS